MCGVCLCTFHVLYNNKDNNNNNVKQLKAELAELLEEAKADALRRLPLYSCRITDFKFVCSRCYDKVYTFAIVKKPKVQKSL